MTYGALITETRQLLQHSATAPVILPTLNDAVALCHARAKLYRALATGADLHLHPPTPALPLPHRSEILLPRERTLLEVLRADLQTAGIITDDTPPPVTGAAPLPVRLTRAADTAAAAFELLTGHLANLQSPQLVHAALRHGATRVAVRDTIELTTALTRLDSRLDRPLRAHAKPDTQRAVSRLLLDTADDCRRTTAEGLHQYATVLKRALTNPTRGSVDGLDIAPTTNPPHNTANPADASQLATQLRRTAADPHRLSVTDLAAIASTGSRIAALTALAAQPLAGPTSQALANVRDWRILYEHLNSFNDPDRGRDLATYAHQFRDWADPVIRNSDPATFTHPDWLPAIQSMTTDLAHLADTTVRAIDHKASNGELNVPFDTRTRGREHLYTAARPDDPRIARLRHAAAEAQHTARQLARDLYHLNPDTHPKPRNVPKPPGARQAARAGSQRADQSTVTATNRQAPPPPQRPNRHHR